MYEMTDKILLMLVVVLSLYKLCYNNDFIFGVQSFVHREISQFVRLLFVILTEQWLGMCD